MLNLYLFGYIREDFAVKSLFAVNKNTYSKSTTGTLEKSAKYVKNDLVNLEYICHFFLVFLLLTLLKCL